MRLCGRLRQPAIPSPIRSLGGLYPRPWWVSHEWVRPGVTVSTLGVLAVGCGVLGLASGWCAGRSPQFEQVVGGGDQFPFVIDRNETASAEHPDFAVVFDLGEDRLD